MYPVQFLNIKACIIPGCMIYASDLDDDSSSEFFIA
jgi:hypothetical protein